jgi:hypothetical protein
VLMPNNILLAGNKHKQVHSINPAWDEWVQTTIVSQVCEALGVNRAPKPPQCKFVKLSIRGRASEPVLGDVSGQSNEDKTTGTFATISIILPSEFTGGKLRLFHTQKSQDFDFARHGMMVTSVLSSYTGLVQELQPVCSGYQISLCYNLVHASNIRPSLPDMSKPLEKLQHILLSWKQSVGDPKVLAYVFKEQYPELGLSMDVLKGSDAHALSYLVPVAQSLNFRVYIANIEIRMWGDVHHGQETGREESYEECGRDFPYLRSESEREVDPDDLELDEDINEEIELTSVVDLDGMPVQIPNLDISRVDHLLGDITLQDPMSSKPDETEYKAHDGDVKHSDCIH